MKCCLCSEEAQCFIFEKNERHIYCMKHYKEESYKAMMVRNEQSHLIVLKDLKHAKRH